MNYSSAVVSEKVDGSLAVVYCYNNEWFVGSSSIPDGSGIITKDTSFAELFWDIWNNTCHYELPQNKKYTYMFELFTPRNPIVVKPERETIILHGVRDNETYQELDPVFIAKENSWESAVVFEFTDIDHVIAASNQMNPAKQEGFVIRDNSFNRVKLKSASYVALSHLSIKGKVNLNAKHMLQIVRTNEASEFIAYFPEYSQLHLLIKTSFEKLVESLYKISQNIEESQISTQLRQFSTKLKDISQLEDIREFLSNYEDLDHLLSLIDLPLNENTNNIDDISVEQALKNRKQLKLQKKLDKKQKKINVKNNM